MRVAIGDMKLPENEATSTRGVPPFVTDEKAVNDYYPFGMTIADRSYQTAGYRYGYNGKENDNEVKGTANSIDFGARIYDPRVTRFLSQDSLKDKISNQSSFLYAGNSPILFIDLDGKIKYPSNVNYEKQYPKLTSYLKNNLKEILQSKNIVNALEKYGQLNRKEIRKVTEWENGPTLKIVNLHPDINGEFTPNINSTEIRINSSIVDNLEKSMGDNIQANLLLVVSTILHEITHYGDDKDKIDFPGEEGESFEVATYGIDIDNVRDANKVIIEKSKTNSSVKDLPTVSKDLKNLSNDGSKSKDNKSYGILKSDSNSDKNKSFGVLKSDSNKK